MSRFCVENKKEITNIFNKVAYISERTILEYKKHIEFLIKDIINQDPTKILNKGYTIAKDIDGKNVISFDQAKVCEEFLLCFRDGKLLVSPVNKKK
ncbi:MAG: hypothetical protein HRT87_09020 [Legionellales bacterium]|nr:hypothetical protein [Legionellales bacterium]